MKNAEIIDASERDNYMTAQEALRFGMIDEILYSEGEEPLEIPVITGFSTANEEIKAGNRLNVDDLNKLDDVIKIMSIIAKISKLKPRKVLLLNSTNIKTQLTDFFEKLLKEELNCKVEILEHNNVIPLWT